MNSRTSILKADPTDWLLENSNPGVRRLALTWLLDRSESNPDVVKAQKETMKQGLIPKILSKQFPDGYWEEPRNFYRAKYKGTAWQLIILAELGADGRDGRIKKACEFILANSQDPESGGFSYDFCVRTGGGLRSGVIPCLTGNMVWSLVKLGRLDDSRVQKGIDWIVRHQRFDDGVARAPRGWPYDRYAMCWGKHTCHMGVVKALKALEAIPPQRRTPAIDKTLASGVEYLLEHHIYKKSHDLNSVSKPGWLQLNFPWMYQTDILEILDILTRLGYRDRRMRDAVDVLLSKQTSDGKWILQKTFNGRFQTHIEQKGKASKWLTVHALAALKRFFSSL